MSRAEIELVRAWLVTRMAALRSQEDRDRGSISMEWAVTLGILIAIAIAIGTVIAAKALAKANEINLQ